MKSYRVHIAVNGIRRGSMVVVADNRDQAAARAVKGWRQYFNTLYPKDKMRADTIEEIGPATATGGAK